MYPALAVLHAIRDKAEILWVGTQGGMEAALIQRANIPFKAIPAAGLHGVGLRNLPGNLLRLTKGYLEAGRILRDYKPDVLFFTGGFIAGPVALAGWRIPNLLYVPDIEPGMALKLSAIFADRIALSAEDSTRFFNRKHTIVTGYPVRPELGRWNRETGREQLGLSSDLPVLLVAGGSRGARSINQAVMNNLPTLLEKMQVIHISGELDWETIEANRGHLDQRLGNRYLAYPYLHEDMGAALAAADLVVSRAGASTLGEYPLFGLPAILVPYPFAWRYQKVNADYLSRHGAAVILEDDQLQQGLPLLVGELLENPKKLQAMSTAMRGLAQPDAAAKIAGQLVELAERSSDRG